MNETTERYGLWAPNEDHPDGGAWAVYQGRTIAGPRDEIGRFVLGDGRFEAHPLPAEVTNTIDIDLWRDRAAVRP
ncbi:hypothetical protein ACWFMI_23470 [Nocardiopsis terrae]|uniref:hypothetical protein n=1 Tax=Streptomyces sp. NPDC057554 TaxID=3350538 RepID=UPI0036A0478A